MDAPRVSRLGERIYGAAVKHQQTASRAKRITDTPVPPPTLEQVREAVEMAWTDATHLPNTPGRQEVCNHLQNAVEWLDGMIRRPVKVRARKKTKRKP